MRRLPWAEEYLETSPSRVQAPEKLRGSWKKPGETLHLEIGAGKGGYSLGLAEKFENERFVAMERNLSAAALAARLYDQNPRDNLHLIFEDAARLPEYFAPEEVDVIHLNFSDPWPKKRNHKRRLSAPSFLEQYHQMLAPKGVIRLKTDNVSFFNDSVLTMLDYGFRLLDLDVNYHTEDNPKDVFSEYEKKFREKNQPIYYAEFENF